MPAAPHQTRIDQFYRVVSNKNTVCSLKSLDQKSIRKQRAPKMNLTTKNSKKCAQKLKFIAKEEKVNTEIIPLEDLCQIRNNSNNTNDEIVSCRNQSLHSKEFFFSNINNVEMVEKAIKNLNLALQGTIKTNEFDLETVYKLKNFSMDYEDTPILHSEKFKIDDIIFTREENANHLLMIVANVFSNPINCGYFLTTELNFIFSFFTLSRESQMLFVRLLKRKLGWHRIDNIKYPEISIDLNPFFEELMHNGFCTLDVSSTDISVLLNMLLANEIRSICEKLKIDTHGNKETLRTRLLKYNSSCNNSFFMGSKSPKVILRDRVLLCLKSCVSLPNDIVDLFHRIFILLNPAQDPSTEISDLFLNLTNMNKGETVYPPIKNNKHFPIFRNRSHLIEFAISKYALKSILISIEKKNWIRVKEWGEKALEHISKEKTRQEKSSVPLHVNKFVADYVWRKVLSKSIYAFKKTAKNLSEVIDILNILIQTSNFSHRNCGKWYSELALIEMHYKKNLESSALLTMHALQQNKLTQVDISDFVERLRKIMRRKNGISEGTKLLIQKNLDSIENRNIISKKFGSKIIFANMMNRIQAKGKSQWSIDINSSSKYYGNIEMLTVQSYINNEDFQEGLHCEGSLPTTLFTVFFWEELYNIFIPGVFISSYQNAPLDLFTPEFYHNRKQKIEEKIKSVRKFDLEHFSNWMQTRYLNYSQYTSIISNFLFTKAHHFKEVIICLGINAVIGICQRLASNFSLWRYGFPDLILWNVSIPKCKIVEVKGPNDTLSAKQNCWLQYLKHLGIEVEVCHVEALHIGSK